MSNAAFGLLSRMSKVSNVSYVIAFATEAVD
jgi:hypothetical protein